MDLLTAYNGLLIRFGLYQLIFGQRWATMLLVTLPNETNRRHDSVESSMDFRDIGLSCVFDTEDAG